eukprot:15344264-Ditylum_brightwellii.AAC.1
MAVVKKATYSLFMVLWAITVWSLLLHTMGQSAIIMTYLVQKQTLSTIHACKLGINKIVNLQRYSLEWFENHALLAHTKKIFADLLQIFGVQFGGTMSVSCALVDRKGNVGRSVVGQIHHHPNDACIVAVTIKQDSI